MINKGLIQEVNGNKIKVHLYKESACAHCSGCGDKNKMGSIFEFKCEDKVEVGNLITFEIEDKSLLNIAALVYLLPILFMIGGYYTGDLLSFSEGKSVATSFLGLFISFGVIHIFDKLKGNKIVDKTIKVVKVENQPITKSSCSTEK